MSKVFAIVILAAAAFWGLVFGKVYAQSSGTYPVPAVETLQSVDGVSAGLDSLK